MSFYLPVVHEILEALKDVDEPLSDVQMAIVRDMVVAGCAKAHEDGREHEKLAAAAGYKYP
tara:strand:+ start:456 stop:638 length:183 start_codon:yes stop_codon:yes gene_type:complete